MAKFLTPVKVGFITLVALGLFMMMVFETTDSPVSGGKAKTVVVYFDNAKGLVDKSKVMVSGIPVGEINSIALDNNRARITMSVRDDLKMYANARAKKIQESLLGTSLVEIWPGTPNNPPFEDGGIITTGEDYVSMEQLFNKVGAISDDVKVITSSLRDSFEGDGEGGDGAKPDLKRIVGNLAEITDALNETIKINRDGVSNIISNTQRVTGHMAGVTGEVQGDLVSIIKDMNVISASLRKMVEGQEKAVTTGINNLSQATEEIGRIMDRTNTLLADLNTISGNIKDGKGTVGKLINDPAVADDISYVTSRARSFISKVDKLELRFDVESNYYPMRNGAKNYVYLQFRPGGDHYYVAGVVSDAWGHTQNTDTVTRTKLYDANGNLTGENVSEEYESETKYELKLTLLYVKEFRLHKWFVPAVYFGLIESTGGVGLELSMFDDWWRVETQFYDWQLEGKPRWKVQTYLTFWEHKLFVTAGMDQLLTDPLDNWFVGAGLQFTDDDLKTLFSIGGSAAAAAVAQ